MLPFASLVVVLCALIGLGLACRSIGQACFRRYSDGISTQLAVLWSVAAVVLMVVVPALDEFRASDLGALASVATLIFAGAAAFALDRHGREAKRLHQSQLDNSAERRPADEATAGNPAPADLTDLCARAARTYNLTRREEDVLLLLADGETTPAIAEKLVLSPNTVKTHVRNLYRKLGINRRADLANRLECGT